MTDFADEARTRRAHMLRMAEAQAEEPDEMRVLRARVLDYLDNTPEPPVMASYGVSTKGCPKCHRTMWHQKDHEGHHWVCASCGHFEELVMTCPRCGEEMKPPFLEQIDRWTCRTCKLVAASGESEQEMLQRDDEVRQAVRTLDAVIEDRAGE
ncbi:hypothetical protein [Streptomyces axinellae]|uniref:Uncharacterized protein n=1 Tax=Streptomyces axinellae TaxID=552788 RepID=A0ABP6C6E9_9ACTN